MVGTYAWKIPRGGYMLDNLHKPLVLGLLLAAPLLLLVADSLRRRARDRDDSKDPPKPSGAGAS